MDVTARLATLRIIEPLRPCLVNIVRQLRAPTNERLDVIVNAAKFIADNVMQGTPPLLTFICTHNSRRSHLAQIWAHIAAEYFGLSVQAYSGGTEVTACDIRTVRAFRRAGMSVVAASGGNNPRYLLQYAEERPPIEVFSKVYNEGGNPGSGYAAMMCCSDVDARCPIVPGARIRIPLHYQDPKLADTTPEEAATYDKRQLQIAMEMFQIMALADGNELAPPTAL
jgi:arsenate reductase